MAVESPSIYHSREVKEMLERFGVPCWVERPAMRATPGADGVDQVYGALLGKEKKAQAYFDGLIRRLAPIVEQENTQSGGLLSITFNGG